MIMNARDIPECTLSLKSLTGVDKLWFRGYTEHEIEPLISSFISKTDYEYYILVSDDVIATQYALDNILKVQSLGVVTGWCNLSPTVYKGTVELQPISNKDTYFKLRNNTPAIFQQPLKTLVVKVFPFTRIWSYLVYDHFPSVDDIFQIKSNVIRTYFVSWALTSMPRQTWLDFPFHFPQGTEKSKGSDSIMSINLHNANIPMYCVRDSFIYHLATKRNFIVGKVKPEMLIEQQLETQIP